MNQTKQKPRSKESLLEKHSPNLGAAIYGKIPPQAREMEAAVLGAIMQDRGSLDIAMEIIPDSDVFYEHAHQIIFMAVASLYNRQKPVDLLTVTDHVRKAGMLEEVGGEYYITTLVVNVGSTAHVESHSRIIVEKYMSRGLIRIGGTVMNAGFDESIDVFDSMDYAEDQLDKLKNRVITKPYRHVSKGVMDATHKIDELKARNVDFTGVTTGFKPLNAITSGWQKSDLIIVAARPSVGKTAFTLNATVQCAANNAYGGPVGIFNLEMSEGQLINRMLACISGVKLKHIANPKHLSQDEDAKLNSTFGRLSSLKIHIDDTAGLTFTEFRSKARKMKRKEGVVMIIVDYLQLMQIEGFSGNREQEISKISRNLKKLAKELEIPIIALSQMNRDVDKEDRAPELGDLRESGAIEQDADMVMFLWRPSAKRIKAKPELAGKILGMIKKHRNGECGEVLFHVDNDIQRWLDEEPTVFTGTFIPDAAEDLPF